MSYALLWAFAYIISNHECLYMVIWLGVDASRAADFARDRLHESFQNLRVDAFPWLVGADIFAAQDPVDADDVSGEFAGTVGLRGNVSGLSYAQARDIRSSTSRRTRREESSASVTTGESNCVDTFSPVCRNLRSTTPSRGERM